MTYNKRLRRLDYHDKKLFDADFIAICNFLNKKPAFTDAAKSTKNFEIISKKELLYVLEFQFSTLTESQQKNIRTYIDYNQLTKIKLSS